MDKIFLPLDASRLNLGETIDFNLYFKTEYWRADQKKYVLFCRRGEILSPGLLAKIRLNNVQKVYYRAVDKNQVTEHLRVGGEAHDQTSPPTVQSDSQNNFQKFFEYQRRLTETRGEQREEHIPLAIKNLHPGVSINFDIFLKARVLGAQAPAYQIFLAKGERCGLAQIDALNKKNTNYVYIHKRDESDVLQYLDHHQSLVFSNNKISQVRKAELIYDVALFWLRRFLYEKQVRGAEELLLGFRLLDNLKALGDQDQNHRGWLLGVLRSDGKLYTHSLNTCILGLAFTKYLGWQHDKIIEFARGTLLHDIGMVEIPENVVNKPGRLSEAEMLTIKQHPHYSHCILEILSSLSHHSLLMVSQHHEHGDGSGYPQGIKLPLINPGARILRIIDSYEAMTSRRCWRDQYDPRKALTIMRQEWHDSGIFDTDYLLEFNKFLIVD
jgi:HD-GYP domain-containing protein (c-di-GMP phosphodiesterase class II)